MFLVTTAQLASLVLVCSLTTYAMLRVAEILARRVINLPKKRLLLVDDDAKEIEVRLVRSGGKIGKKRLGANQVAIGKGSEGRVYTLQGEAAYGGDYPTWALHKRHGVNLLPEAPDNIPEGATVNYKGPTDAGFFHATTIMGALTVFDPALNYKAIAINDAQDTVNKNDDGDKWGWVMPVVLGAAVVLVAILGMLVFIVTKMKGA